MWSKMYIGLHVKYWLLLSDFKETKNFLKSFPPPPKFMKGRQVGAESFQADRHDAGNTPFSQIYKCT